MKSCKRYGSVRLPHPAVCRGEIHLNGYYKTRKTENAQNKKLYYMLSAKVSAVILQITNFWAGAEANALFLVPLWMTTTWLQIYDKL